MVVDTPLLCPGMKELPVSAVCVWPKDILLFVGQGMTNKGEGFQRSDKNKPE